MNAPLRHPPSAEPFFLNVEQGERFCIFHPPDPRVPARAAILYVHPFSEELNKTRRMVALQARAFAASGYAVLVMDLYGCGDSAGDFADARWEIWRADLAAGHAWLTRHAAVPIYAWGLRLGALLALEHACAFACRRVILWHPQCSGKASAHQFLRMELAAQMLGSAQEEGAGAPRARLERRGSIEVGGYTASLELVRAIEERNLEHMTPAHCTIDWFDAQSNARASASAARLAARWAKHGSELRLHGIDSLAFWNSTEIGECTELLRATGDALYRTDP
ncbi:MAG: hydrolase 2, exosortase A system-associated [Pseudomonadota bacterium]